MYFARRVPVEFAVFDKIPAFEEIRGGDAVDRAGDATVSGVVGECEGCASAEDLAAYKSVLGIEMIRPDWVAQLRLHGGEVAVVVVRWGLRGRRSVCIG